MFQTPIRAGKTCIMKTAITLGSTGYVTIYISYNTELCLSLCTDQLANVRSGRCFGPHYSCSLHTYEALSFALSIESRLFPTRPFRRPVQTTAAIFDTCSDLSMAIFCLFLALPSQFGFFERWRFFGQHTSRARARGLGSYWARAPAVLYIFSYAFIIMDALEPKQLGIGDVYHGRCQCSSKSCTFSHPDLSFTIMKKMRTLVTTYEAKLKDRLIISAEVLHEYDQKVRIYSSIFAHNSYNLLSS